MNKKVIRKVLSLMNHITPSYLPLLVLINALAAVTPFINIIMGSDILDAIIRKDSFEEVMKLALLMICLNVGCNLIRWGLEKVKLVKETEISSRIDLMLCDKSLSIDYEILEKKETLTLIEKAQEGSNAGGGISALFQNMASMIQIISTIVYSVILLVPLFIPGKLTKITPMYQWINKWYSAIILILMLVIILFVNYCKDKHLARIRQEGFEHNINGNRIYGYLFYFMYQNKVAKDIRMYNMADMIEKEIFKFREEMLNYCWKMLHKENKSNAIGYVGYYLFLGACYSYIGVKALAGLISVGSVMRYVSVFVQMATNMGRVMSTLVEIRLKCQYLNYLVEFLDIENEKYEGTLPIEKRDDNDYVIEFRDVSFHYPNSEKMVLSHVSIKLKVGKKMAVVGQNGAGKTTFIKLLCRLYDPTEGQILLNGIDIKLYDYREYMQIFSVVFQDFQLFSFSIAENVATSLDYEEDKIRECLQMAGFEERLANLPDDIFTNIYQFQKNGVEISGGEAQKIAIARALYKDSPIVILDEPTSALDPISEYDIYCQFDKLVNEKTAIYISHRMSSCRFCDNIVVFDQGNIVQHGSHESLVSDGDGVYAKMWNAQAQYYQ